MQVSTLTVGTTNGISDRCARRKDDDRSCFHLAKKFAYEEDYYFTDGYDIIAYIGWCRQFFVALEAGGDGSAERSAEDRCGTARQDSLEGRGRACLRSSAEGSDLRYAGAFGGCSRLAERRCGAIQAESRGREERGCEGGDVLCLGHHLQEQPLAFRRSRYAFASLLRPVACRPEDAGIAEVVGI